MRGIRRNRVFLAILVLVSVTPAQTIAQAVRAEEAARRPNYNYRSLEAQSKQPAGRQLYKHVDDKGRLVYTDAPKEAGQKSTKLNAVNVESPEARRQMNIELQNKRQEENAERIAAARRYAPIQQREREEAARKRRGEEALHPEFAPRPIRRVVP